MILFCAYVIISRKSGVEYGKIRSGKRELIDVTAFTAIFPFGSAEKLDMAGGYACAFLPTGRKNIVRIGLCFFNHRLPRSEKVR